MKKLIVASTSTLYGSGYLEYLLTPLQELFAGVNNIVFIPYARPSGISHDQYTKIAQTAFQKIGKTITGIHEFKHPDKAILEAEGLFVGGGNSFVLLNELYTENLISPLKEAINSGTPYLGTSAGSNICGLTMGTSNDMPIVHPKSFDTLGVLPFNINPHYQDPDPKSKHMGETRETRIQEFHVFNPQAVIGLREGSYLQISDKDILLKGPHTARIFEANRAPYEIKSESNLNQLSKTIKI